MGIRLYFRNKDKPEEEYCLGKLYSYIDEKDKCTSVKWLLEFTNALDEFVENPYARIEENVEAFLLDCACMRYIDYGEFFELSTCELCLFLIYYGIDWESLWYDEGYKFDLEHAIAFIGTHEACVNRWEFRLGA